MDLVEVRVTATTGKTRRSRLTYKDELVKTPAGLPRIVLTVGGTIGSGVTVTYPLWTRQRTATAAYTLRAALEAQGVAVGGDLKVMELGDFVGATVGLGALPVELARHDSRTAADIAATVNKWSINWLSDRLIMTAAGLAARKPPSMDLAIEAMYSWLARHPRLGKGAIIIDTGSGLSYKTQISPQELVSVVRSAAGFVPDDTTEPVASAWLRSLSVAGMDGTLGHRFRGTGAAGHIFGKTGTLSTAIALSGVLDVDPQRPLAFALVTNTDAPLSKPYIRRAHELVLAEICKYMSKTAARPLVTPGAPVPEVAVPAIGTAPLRPGPAANRACARRAWCGRCGRCGRHARCCGDAHAGDDAARLRGGRRRGLRRRARPRDARAQVARGPRRYRSFGWFSAISRDDSTALTLHVQPLAVRHCPVKSSTGERVPSFSSWGSTTAAPPGAITAVHTRRVISSSPASGWSRARRHARLARLP